MAIHITTGEPAQIVRIKKNAWPLKFIIRAYREVIRSARNPMSSFPTIPKMANVLRASDAVLIDTRKSEPELYVADRGNGRVQVYDPEGNWKREFGSDFLTSPSGFATHGDLLVIAELKARLTICNGQDELVVYLGANGAVADVDGWPNNKNEKGESVRTSLLEEGKFNSPHGMAVDADGNILVAEWLIGGRFIKLAKV